MTITALGSEFDAFLFAPIVVSALARLDVDPWTEAAKLARLPKPAAASRLAGLLADLPGGPPAHFDPRKGAARLVDLLPRAAVSENLTPRVVQTAIAVPNYHIIAFVVLAVLMFSVQYVIASRQAATPVEAAGSTVAGADSAKEPTGSAP